jgi:hypothetical protein
LIDGSNWKAFQGAVETLSMASTLHLRLLQEITSPQFSTSLDRPDGSGMSLASFRTQPTLVPFGQQQDVLTTTPTSRNRKNRQKSRATSSVKGGESFQSWQDQLHWKKVGDSLSLPSLRSVPLTILDIARERVTLQWNQSFVPLPTDQTDFGIRVTTCVLGISEHDHQQELQEERERERERATELEGEAVANSMNDLQSSSSTTVRPIATRWMDRFAFEAVPTKTSGSWDVKTVYLDADQLSNPSSTGAVSTSSHNAVNAQLLPLQCTERTILRAHKVFQEKRFEPVDAESGVESEHATGKFISLLLVSFVFV